MTSGRLIALAGAAVLLAAMLLDWYAFDIEGTALGGDTTINAFEAFAWIDLVLLVAIVAAAVAASGAQVPVLGDRRAVLVAGAASALLIAYRWIDPAPVEGDTGFATVDVGVRIGLYAGLAGALAVVAGGVKISRRP